MLKFFKRVISAVFVFILISGTARLCLIRAGAANYNANAALSYAAAHWNDVSTGGSDQELCAGFVSNCLKTGGINVMQRIVINLYEDLKSNGYGTPYILTKSSNRIPLSLNNGKVGPGDPVFFYCKNCDVFRHVVLCGGNDSSGYLTAYGHNIAEGNTTTYTNWACPCGAVNWEMYSIKLGGFFDFWGDSSADNRVVGGTVKFWFKQVGYYNQSNIDVNVYLDGKAAANALGTIYMDANGFFAININTEKFTNGPHILYAALRTSGVEVWTQRTVTFSNTQFFDFWGDSAADNRVISGKGQFNFKQTAYYSLTSIDVNIHLDGKAAANALGTVYMDANGYFVFNLNSENYSNGPHTIYAVLRTYGVEKWVQRSIVIQNTKDITVKGGSTTVVNQNKNLIYGLKVGLTKLQFESNYIQLVGNVKLEYLTSAVNLGTGATVNVIDNAANSVTKAYTIVIFGDINSDGIIDATDADTCINLQNWLVTWNHDSEECYYKAGDVNGDGNVDAIDADIMTEAANYRMQIDQTTGLAAIQ